MPIYQIVIVAHDGGYTATIIMIDATTCEVLDEVYTVTRCTQAAAERAIRRFMPGNEVHEHAS